MTIHPDQRGNVRETYRTSWFPQVPPIKQLVRSESRPQTLRGMHLHRKQWDLWHFVSGSALVRIVHPDGTEFYQRADAGLTLAIAPGHAHGFYTEDGCVLMYALTEEYDGTDEYGFYPFDGLRENSHPGWPRNHIGLIVSERDIRATRLESFDW